MSAARPALPRRMARRMAQLALCLAVACAVAGPLWPQEGPPRWHQIEAINPGLAGPPGGDVDRSSPRAALRAFLELTDAGDFAAAAHLLNLSNLPQDDQQAQGARLAERLASTIDRKLSIDWSGIPPEPDAWTPEGPDSQSPARPRRDYSLGEFEIAGQPYAIRLGRYAEPPDDAEAAADPIWLFSRDTVEHVDTLHRAFGPRPFEAHIPEAMQGELGGLKIWEWVALPLLIATVTLVGFATSRLVRLGRHMFDRRVARRAFDRAALPLALVAASVTAQWLLGFMGSFPERATAIIGPVLVMLAAVGISLAALRVVDALLDHVTRRHLGNSYDAPNSSEREFYTSIYALRRIILVVTVGFSVIFVLMQFNIFADMGVTLLASAGVLTVILGIAGQLTLGNILASLQIAIAKPVRIGDSIHYEGDWCIVESIFFTFIRLRTWDERRIIVPVKYFLTYPFRNWSVINEHLYCTIRLVLDPMADVEVLREKFLATARADPGVIEPGKLCVCVTDHSAQGLTVAFYAMAPDPVTAWSVEMRLREELVGFVRREHPGWWWRERISF